MNTKFKPPYLGVAYYPEDWDESEIDRDIAKMKQAGINAARVAEFAWHKMEPKEGQYEFGWLHKVVDKLGEAGIAVILGTPTATPPRWFTLKHPESLREFEPGTRTEHGGRRHCCSNNPDYREASAKITEAMAKEFADDPNVIGWQCDNEIYGEGCFCEHCQKKFVDYLKEKFGTVEKLNEEWNLNLFSQAYDSFDDLPLPTNTWVNPHHKQEWCKVQNIGHIDFIHMQADILHRYVSVPVGTDTMPFASMDYREMNSKLDVVQFNHYNDPDNIQNVCFWFDYLRTIKARPFWNTETQTCWNGNTGIGQSIKPENFCYINSWLPLALGGEANMYWLWRTHWAGHELMHGSVLDTSGRPQHILPEVKKTAADFAKAADFLNSTKVSTQVGFHFSSLNWIIWQTQHVVKKYEYDPTVYEMFYRPLVDLGVRPDVIDTVQPLDGYKIIFSPMMLSIDENGLPERLEEWVENGGVWVVGPLSDVRRETGTKYCDRPFGILEKLIGETWLYGIPDTVNHIKSSWNDGEDFDGGVYYQVFSEQEGALVNINYGHSELVGKPIVIKKKYGKGTVIVLGTFPSAKDAAKLFSFALAEAGVDCSRTPDGNIMVVPREGGERKGLILAEYANKGGRYVLEKKMTDILSGRTLEGEISVKPYEVLVLE